MHTIFQTDGDWYDFIFKPGFLGVVQCWVRCVHSTPDRSRDLGTQKNSHGAVGMPDMPLFKGGRATDVASCMSSCMCHCVSHCMSPLPLCGTQWGAPTPGVSNSF